MFYRPGHYDVCYSRDYSEDIYEYEEINEDDLNNFSIPKFIILFLTLNIVFITFIILAINLI